MISLVILKSCSPSFILSGVSMSKIALATSANFSIPRLNKISAARWIALGKPEINAIINSVSNFFSFTLNSAEVTSKTAFSGFEQNTLSKALRISIPLFNI